MQKMETNWTNSSTRGAAPVEPLAKTVAAATLTYDVMIIGVTGASKFSGCIGAFGAPTAAGAVNSEMRPENKGGSEGVTSALVCRVTAPPAVATPMAKPMSVTMTELGDAMVPEPTVTAMELAPDIVVFKVMPCDKAEISEPDKKKPDG